MSDITMEEIEQQGLRIIDIDDVQPQEFTRNPVRTVDIEDQDEPRPLEYPVFNLG